MSKPNFKQNSIGGHALAGLGYNDDYEIDGVKGAFLICNSWGTDWGADMHGKRGFCWMPYSYFTDPKLSTQVGHYINMKFTVS